MFYDNYLMPITTLSNKEKTFYDVLVDFNTTNPKDK